MLLHTHTTVIAHEKLTVIPCHQSVSSSCLCFPIVHFFKKNFELESNQSICFAFGLLESMIILLAFFFLLVTLTFEERRLVFL